MLLVDRNYDDDSERYLEQFRQDWKIGLHQNVTMDETCIHHFTLESNRQAAEWTAADEPRPKTVKDAWNCVS